MKTACRILAGLGALLALTAAAPSAHAQMAAPQGEWGTHVVHAGESLFDVASRYRMATQDLARLNGRALGDILWPGQALWIPVANVRSARAGQTARAASNRRGTKPPAPLRSASAGVRPYTVQPGDTLSTIAASLGTDVDSLIRLNGLPLDGSIQAGATLIVEGQAKDDAAAEPLPTRAAGPAPSGATTAAYTVQAGDTLSTIATRFGESATALQRLNGLADDAIYEGQTLLIPAQGQGPTTALGGAKRIVVDVSEQRMYVWQGDALVWNFVASTGLAGYPTQRGSFQVQSKIPTPGPRPGSCGCPIGWASTGPAARRTASTPCRSSTARPCGKATWARPSATAAWSSQRRTRRDCTTGRRRERRWMCGIEAG